MQSSVEHEENMESPPIRQTAGDKQNCEQSVYETTLSDISHEEDEVAGDHDVLTPQQAVGEENDGGLFTALDRIGSEKKAMNSGMQ